MSATTPVDGSSFDPARDLFDPFAPGVMDDPFPYYAVLRDRAPAHFNPQLGMCFLSRYDDVFRADADLARFARGQQARAYDSYTAATRVIFNNNLFAKDPPDHTRLKRLFSRAFTRSLVEGMRPRIEELCRQVLDAAGLAPGGGTMELIGDFAYPFPALVICEMLGIPNVHQTGAGLARIEVAVAMRTLLDRITPVRITSWEQRPSKRLWGPSRVDLEYR